MPASTPKWGPWATGRRVGPVVSSRRALSGLPMVLALMVWLCSLALVALFVVPFFGGRVAALVALGLLVVIVLGCHAVCISRVDPGKERP